MGVKTTLPAASRATLPWLALAPTIRTAVMRRVSPLVCVSGSVACGLPIRSVVRRVRVSSSNRANCRATGIGASFTGRTATVACTATLAPASSATQ